MLDKKNNSSKLTLIIPLFFVTIIFALGLFEIAMSPISNITEYLPEKLKNLDLLYSFDYSDTNPTSFHAFQLNESMVNEIKKEGVNYLQKSNYSYQKCGLSIYNCKWKVTPVDESIRAYKGLQRALDRQVDARIWLEMEGKNGYYFTAKNRTIVIVVLPRLSLLLYATGD